jgi:hypothetical protein
MDYAIIAAVIVLLAIGYAGYMSKKSRVWVIKVRNGNSTLTRGRIAQTVVAELADVLHRNGVKHGALYGIRRRGTVTLGFSRSIPQSCRQGLRNVWSMHAR